MVANDHIPLRSNSKLLRGRDSCLAASRDDAPLTLGALRALMSESRGELPITFCDEARGRNAIKDHVKRSPSWSGSNSSPSHLQFRPPPRTGVAGPPLPRFTDASVAEPPQPRFAEASVAGPPQARCTEEALLTEGDVTAAVRDQTLATASSDKGVELGTEEAEELALQALLDRDARRQAQRDKKKAEEKNEKPEKPKAAEKEPKHDRVLRRPAGCDSVAGSCGKRPLPTTKPTPYLQGKLFVDSTNKRVRAYKHVSDKVESSFSFKARPFAEAWSKGCAAIEDAQQW